MRVWSLACCAPRGTASSVGHNVTGRQICRGSPETLPLLGILIYGYLERGIQTPMAQGRSTKIISMIKWIRTSRLSMKNSPSSCAQRVVAAAGGGEAIPKRLVPADHRFLRQRGSPPPRVESTFESASWRCTSGSWIVDFLACEPSNQIHKTHTRNSEPRTPNPEPQTPNPEPPNPNPETLTPHLNPQIPNPKPYTLKQVRIHRKMNHPGVVQLLGVYTLLPNLFIILECVEVCTLHSTP